MIVDHDDIALRAGRLTHKVTIQRPVETQSDTGSPVTVWTDFARVWADLSPLSGKEYIRAQQMQSGIQVRATIRKLEGIDATMRLVFQGLNYNIQAILADPRYARHLTLMLEVGVNAG